MLASGNAGKLLELRALLAPLGAELAPQAGLGVPPVEEPHPTFIENALAKARHAAQVTGRAALADDSGLCCAALDGAPGVRSARYAADEGSDAPDGEADRQNNRLLVRRLSGCAERRAQYVCVLVALRSAADPEPLVAQGRWDGEIVDEPRGTGGFGYDPHFWLPAWGCTVAELPAAEKNRVSHRAQAMAALVAALQERWWWDARSR